MYYSLVDRIRCCNNCGEEGHIAAMCRLKPHCPICAERDGSASYRSGGPSCLPRPPHRVDGCSARVPANAPVPEVGVHGAATPRVTDPAIIAVPRGGNSTTLSSSPHNPPGKKVCVAPSKPRRPGLRQINSP